MGNFHVFIMCSIESTLGFKISFHLFAPGTKIRIHSKFLNLRYLGEWKLGGVEFMYPFTDTNVPIKLLHSLKCYDPPETGRPVVKKGEKW